MTGTSSTDPRFEVADDRPGVTIVDPIENRRFPLTTPEPVAPTAADTGGFDVPVDAAVEFRTRRITLPYVVPTCVRDRTGERIVETEHYALETLPAGEYLVELMAPNKLYLEVESATTIASSDQRLEVNFDGPTGVRLGVRSAHERPAATVTTTADPDDLARAVSTFGSALKTLGCERSLPTFRGHPPRLSLGDGLEIPDAVASPSTGVRIVVPPERAAVLASSSLAYYLGATVVTGDRPRIETADGFEYELDRGQRALETSVETVLEHVLFWDAVTRSEGIYGFDLHARREVEARLDLDLEAVYESSLADQLATYLSIPIESVADLRPTWQLATYVQPGPEAVPVLPFLANDLSHVREAPSIGRGPEPGSVPTGVDAFTQPGESEDEVTQPGGSEDERRGGGWDGSGESAGESPIGDGAGWPPGESYVTPPETDTFETGWLGDGIPTRGNKLLVDSFEHGLEQSTASDAIDVTVVCNDRRMAAEYEDARLYGDREELPFDVTIHRDLTVDRLRSVLSAETDLLHYVGHVEDGALVCRDGALDPREVEAVGVDAFLLNGCRSYAPGRRLIEAGGVGGIVTLSDVENEDAAAVGRTIARLLNGGFSLRSAVNVARETRFVGNQYVVVGDGGLTVAQAGGGVPNRCRLDRVGQNRFELTLRTYHSQHGHGALYIPYLDQIDRHFLAGTELDPIELTDDEVARFFDLETVPVEYEGSIRWSTDDRFGTN